MDHDQIEDAATSAAIPESIRDDLLELVASAGGSVWSRNGLTSSERSMVTIAILTALGRTDELREHVRLGVDSFDLSPTQIGELILHSAVYAGFPAALEAFRVANEELQAPQPV